MQLTLNSLSALRLTRSVRCGLLKADLSKRCEILSPNPAPHKRWSARMLRQELSRFGEAGAFSPQHPLHVLSPTKATRLQLKGVKSAFRSTPHSKGSFVDLGKGIAMSSPELSFVEMANVMEPVVHPLLGMELCGRFSRDPIDPRNGPIAYDIEPVTSIERLRAFAQAAPGIRGARKALQTIDQLVANAWSPTEALLATLLVLPGDELGYDLWPITLNPRKEASEHIRAYTHTSSRVPDIMFSGTTFGLNYDGEDHFGLRRITETAVAAERDPGNGHLAQEAAHALADARKKDHRRQAP